MCGYGNGYAVYYWFYNHIPTGALLLVSDQPMIPEGVKTEKSDSIVTQQYVEEHVEIGIASLQMIIEEKKTVKHLNLTGNFTVYGKRNNIRRDSP